MLAATTTESLHIGDPNLLKKTLTDLAPCLDLLDKPISSCWCPDNSFLDICSATTVYRYNPGTNSIKDVYSSTGSDDKISCLVSKDKNSVIFSEGSKLHILDCGNATKVTSTFDTHKSAITSLSLSNDDSLLASTSAAAVHVHNLFLGSHTVLRGLNLSGLPITTCAFHQHSKTRLLVASGKQVLIYDTARPSSPMKTVLLGESASGSIVAVACSPFSKTLVAAATSSGYVGLIDLEKEKPLFRTLNLKVSLTSLGFSPEGAAIFVGTETGKILVVDLRALDKPPKVVVVSSSGCRIESISVQKKIKGATEATPKNATSAVKVPTEPLPASRRPAATSKVAASPARMRQTPASSSPLIRKKPSLREGPTAKSPVSKPSAAATSKKVNSRVHSPGGSSSSGGDISVELDTIGIRQAAKDSPPKAIRPSASPKATRRVVSSSSSVSSTRAKAQPVAHKSSSPTSPRSRPSSATLSIPANARPRTASSASRAPASETDLRPSAASARSAASRPLSAVSRQSRTPSPDLPDIHSDPITPKKEKTASIGVLGLTTPEVKRWVNAGKGVDRTKDHGKGKGKSVGFTEDAQKDGEDKENNPTSSRDSFKDKQRSGKASMLAMQVSPRRPAMPPSASGTSANSWAPSPLRQSTSGGSLPVSGGSSAHELLKSIVQDVMLDYQRQTKAEIEGLHLDLLRVGRSWRTELRTLMDEYVGDLNDLRDENRRLREENERLRRGF